MKNALRGLGKIDYVELNNKIGDIKKLTSSLEDDDFNSRTGKK
jgi:hypothetical protein